MMKHEENILLIGFMGCGKTTVANALHDAYGMDIIDTDALIADREGMSISDIFAQKGEEYFRNLETQLLIELQGVENTVISCGGGMALREVNVAEMKKAGRVVLLTASPETIYERVKDDHSRPLLENNKSVEFIADMLEARGPKYRAAADIVVATDGRTAEEICREICR